jgi:hypothetical protein
VKYVEMANGGLVPEDSALYLIPRSSGSNLIQSSGILCHTRMAATWMNVTNPWPASWLFERFRFQRKLPLIMLIEGRMWQRGFVL